MTKLIEVRERLVAKQAEWHTIYQQYPDLDMPDDVAADLKARNDEMTVLGKERDRLAELDAIAQNVAKAHADNTLPVSRPAFPAAQSGAAANVPAPYKSFGELFIESPAFKDYNRATRRGPAAELDTEALFGKGGREAERKALMTLASYPLLAQDLGLRVTAALRRPVVADLIPQDTTTSGTQRYLEETTTTNGAAAVAEGAAKPESTLVYSERTAVVRKIATILQLTDEMMADAPTLRAVIDARLRLFIELEEERELLLGSGVAPELLGLLTTSGIQTQAKGADPTPDAIYKAMVKIQTVAFLDPSGVVMNPLDWQDVRLLRTADGIYIWGAPMDPGPERIWGLPVVNTVVMTQNTALVGAFNAATQIFRRQGVEVVASTEHGTNFATNQTTIRAEERLTLVVWRPAGLCTVTGV